MNRIQAEDILVRVSLDSRLQEGYQGVRLIMRDILKELHQLLKLYQEKKTNWYVKLVNLSN